MRLRYLQRHLIWTYGRSTSFGTSEERAASSKRRYGSSMDVRATAKACARTNSTLMRQVHRLGPNNRLLVHYEELCRDPDGTLATLYAFCGVDSSVAPTLSYETQHLLGSRGRLESTTEIRLDDSWRSSLGPEDVKEIWNASLPVMRSLYPSAAGCAG